MVICKKCNKDITEEWERYKTFRGANEHHNPPEFMMERWQGELIWLCRKHHEEIHKEIIKILNEVVGTLKFCNSEHWVWIKMPQTLKNLALKEVVKFTEEWLKNE